MPTITLSKELTQTQDLIAVPRKMYEEFLAWQKIIKSSHVFIPTATEKKALVSARKNLKRGKCLTLEQLKHALANRG